MFSAMAKVSQLHSILKLRRHNRNDVQVQNSSMYTTLNSTLKSVATQHYNYSFSGFQLAATPDDVHFSSPKLIFIVIGISLMYKLRRVFKFLNIGLTVTPEQKHG